MLDAVGSEAVEAAADALMEKMDEEINRAAGPHTLTGRFSPGYGDWDIREQHLIFRLLEGEKVRIKMTPSCLMVPRKSISFIVGIRPGKRRGVKKDRGDCFSVPCSLDPCKFKSESNTKEGSK
jgi:cobalamin-dependent methionine synthase I